jgi:phosphomannomutase
LALSIATAERNQSPLIIANDPDADRLAVAEREATYDVTQADGGADWRVFNGNEIGAMFACWCWKQACKDMPADADKSKYAMVTTAVSSKLLKAIADAEGFRFEETLTGFKWIGNKAVELAAEGVQPLFGYEEAIGFMIGDTAFDKDGVRAAAVFSEMAQSLYAADTTIAAYLESIYAKYGFFEIQTKYFFCYEPAKMTEIFLRLRGEGKADADYMWQCGEHKVARIRDQTTGFDSAEPDKKTRLPSTPGAHMITYTFENGCVVTLRGSGTEPKLKYYVEMGGKEERSAVVAKQRAMTVAVVEHFLQPEANGLVAPKEG